MTLRPLLYDVVHAVDLPVRAVPGEVLVITAGHPVAPVAVMRKRDHGPWELLRIAPPDFTTFLPLLLNTGTVRPRRSA